MKKGYALLLCLCMLLCGCRQSGEEIKSQHKIWYLNESGTELESAEHTFHGESVEEQVNELLDDLSDGQKVDGIPLLGEEIYVNSFHYDGGSLTLDLCRAYLTLPRTREILIRAGLVRTLTQISDVYRVAFTVNEEPLRDSGGSLYGYMTADSFIENSGGDLNQYQYVTLSLYFANETGDRLVKESRVVAYSTSKPLERVVVEQLLKGPENSNHIRVLPEGTNILNVTSSEQIAYVNFDNSFNTILTAVKENVTIYAIVNSLIENCKDTKVQISINGQSDILYRDQVDLGHFFEEDYSLLEESQSKQTKE